ncbi:MAG: glycoside hydrolase family 9 protein, partial [Pseudomonadota bacterium]|nr:glycoside hydrolase family 9 protein [Pseudomonadota bacterium]
MRNARKAMIFRLIAAVALTGGAIDAAAAAPLQPGYIRADQVGYETGAVARAFLVTRRSAAGATYLVKAKDGQVVLTGPVGPPAGPWGAYVVTPLALSGLAGGHYDLSVTGVDAQPGRLVIDAPVALYAAPMANALAFYQTERDGPDYIPSALRTAPGHLNDKMASVFETPPVAAHDLLVGPLKPTGEVIDAAGGWWDAGDYMKYVETISYTVPVLLTGIRDFPQAMGARAQSDFTQEAKFGLAWLLKMWNDRSATLYYQTGNSQDFTNSNLLSDYDLWRLPQVDDTLHAGDPRYIYINHRPVFVAGPAGSPISPNLAGRLTAAFALGFAQFRHTDPAFAQRCLRAAEHIYDLADTHPGKLLTVLPFDGYPETEWRDDLEWGAAELSIALALGRDSLPVGLPRADAHYYLAQSANWAAAYIGGPGDGADTLNLYDVSGLAHFDLYRAIRLQGGGAGLAVSPRDLLTDLRQQLRIGTDHARSDPFGFGGPWNEADSIAHGMGLAVTAQEVAELGGDHAANAEAADWIGNILGANIWGVTMIVGDGDNPTACLQHQVANLEGSRNGRGLVLRGAAVEGPNTPNAVVGGHIPGLLACPVDGVDTYRRFTGDDSRFKDNAENYVNTEPALDLTALAPLMFAWRM